jgi:hypothetical protein
MPAVVACFAVLLTGCGGDEDTSAAPTVPAATTAGSVAVAYPGKTWRRVS